MKRLISLVALFALCCCSHVDTDYLQEVCSGPIYPDYVGVTVPVDIAPLNWCYVDGKSTVTTFSCGDLSVKLKGAEVVWNEARWHKFLSAASGKEVVVTAPGREPWSFFVSPDPIDWGMTYRLVKPGYERFGAMGLYERDLTSFTQRPLIVNNAFEGCVNCHEPKRSDPSFLSVHIRGEHGATLVDAGDGLSAYNTKTDSTLASCVYPYWHPSGKYVAYSTNATKQSFHIAPPKDIEVYDLDSDIQVLDVEGECIVTAPSVKDPSYYESFPVFSPDGDTLYFTRAEALPMPASASVMHYTLCKVAFDPEGCRIGSEVETLLDIPGKSIAFPKPSYDGRYIMYTLADYGTFPIWHHEADLWLLDLQTGENRPLDEANSPDTDSYHNWDSSSRWFLFASRRDDGRFTRVYISHFAEDGTVGKPFMLPQKHPAVYYRDQLFSFNVPSFVSGPVDLDRADAIRKINAPERRNLGFRWSD